MNQVSELNRIIFRSNDIFTEMIESENFSSVKKKIICLIYIELLFGVMIKQNTKLIMNISLIGFIA